MVIDRQVSGGCGGAIYPFREGGGAEKLHGDPTIGPRPKV